ncbi:TauD/TfdA family dioxygenase [Nocardiopsis sp. JB363]|uniref:TauD/TfdA family dioxygenase n=1 Tax=Nocardiopsis sp. JB363 TaxID=1434837 RepID=UPI00097A2E4E|nr:TauD/TfdA family dioxygenase [Nocardiopsis sp. JB363]SIO91383.1 oxygenase (secreted protein) [Nocardiopsis sp. JB363]
MSEEVREIHETARNLALSYKGGGEPLPSTEVVLAAHGLPRRVREFLYESSLRDSLHAVLVRGYHVEQGALGPTPEHWRQAENPASATYSCALLLLSALVGEVIGWESQQDARIVTDVLPSRGSEHSLVSSSSVAELGWHTEDAFSQHRADHVGLMCLRGAEGAATTLSSVRSEQLSARTLELLGRRYFLIRPDDAHTAEDDSGIRPVALLGEEAGARVLRIDRDFTRPLAGVEGAAEALDELVRALDDGVYDLRLESGDVCFIDNRNAVHGRRPFKPRFDGSDRWLKRVNLVTDLRRTRSGRSGPRSRIIKGIES